MGDCGCGDVTVVDRAPEGFRALSRGAHRTLEAAVRAAKRAAREGVKNVVVVHNRETVMHEESWHVGHAPPSTAVGATGSAVARETADAVSETADAVSESAPPRLALPSRESFVLDACQIAPFYELRRVPGEFRECFRRAHEFGKVANARRAYDLVIEDVAREDQEVFYVAALDAKVYCRGVMRVHRGVRDATMVSAPVALQAAFAMGATASVFYHCHPTGNAARPSDADRKLTEDLVAACAAAKMGFFDHVVVASQGEPPMGEYFSFANQRARRVLADGSEVDV